MMVAAARSVVQTFDIQGIVFNRDLPNILRILRFVLDGAEGAYTWITPDGGLHLSATRPDQSIRVRRQHVATSEGWLQGVAEEIDAWLRNMTSEEARRLNSALPLESSSRNSFTGFGLRTRYRSNPQEPLIFQITPAWVWSQR